MITSNQTFKESCEPIIYNMECAADALKGGNNGKHLARFFIKKAEKVYDFLLNASYFDEIAYKQIRLELNALKGLTYYSLRNPPQDAEYALSLIQKKQAMRRIKRMLKDPIEKSSVEIDSLVQGERSGKVEASLNRFKKYMSSGFNAEYDRVISRIDDRLRICGVGKF